MRDEIKKLKLFSRRSVVLGGIKLALISTVLGRYYYLQIMKSDRYSTLSDKNRIKLIILPAPRGRVVDKDNNEISATSTHFRLTINPLYTREAKEIIPEVEKILGHSLYISDEILRRRLLKRTRNEPLVLEENISWQDMAKVSENNHLIEPVEVIEGISRTYNNGEAFAHILGYIGSPNEKEMESLDLPKFGDLRIGKSGLERVFDQQLRGTPGYKKVEVDVHGQFVREISRQDAVQGEQLQLTIDSSLQEFVHAILSKRAADAAVIVLNAKTGSVLALHSTPSFDPNQFADGVTQEYWDEITSNSGNPLINNAVSSPYPPGSTFKLVTALSGLINGIDPEKKVLCTGSYSSGTRSFRCWNANGHGYLGMKDAIAQSCNPYFYTISQSVGINKIAQAARILGYDHKTGIELLDEHKGLIPDTAWKKERYKENWYPGDTINASIGQGYVLVTPIQLAISTARIATGKLIYPTLLHNHEEVHPSELNGVSKEQLDIIREGMYRCANQPGGVVFRHQMSIGDFTVAGKTGTAQVADMKLKDKGRKFKHHALFTSYAPTHDPQYVVTVVVEHGEGGSKSAAPIAKQIYLKLMGKPTEIDAVNNIVDEDA